MEKTIQYNQIEIVDQSHIDGRYMLPLTAALDRFAETKQDVRRFDVYLYSEKDGVVEIAFSPKSIPGKKSLGGSNENGYGISYQIRVETGEIIKSLLAR